MQNYKQSTTLFRFDIAVRSVITWCNVQQNNAYDEESSSPHICLLVKTASQSKLWQKILLNYHDLYTQGEND